MHHLTPQSILHLSIFTHFCEAFLGILPHFHLFQYFFILVPVPNATKPAVVGGCELIFRPEIQRVKDSSGRNSGSMSGTLNLHFQKEILVPSQVQENWSSNGPGGKQVECILRAIANWKNKGITGDHVVFSFVSRRIQPLQHRKHPAFRYEGTKDPTRLSPEAMAHSEGIR